MLILLTISSIAQPIPKTDYDRWEEATYGKPPKTTPEHPAIRILVNDTKIQPSTFSTRETNEDLNYYQRVNPITNRVETYNSNNKLRSYRQYNPITNTYDEYNSQGVKIGYYRYNPLLQQIEFIKK